MQIEQKDTYLQKLTLLSQIPQHELENLVSTYKSILTFAKIVCPFLVAAILCMFAFQSSQGSHSDFMSVVMMVLITCIGVFIILVPIAFIKLYALIGRIKKIAQQHYWNENQLIDEFQIYVRCIIKIHFGVKLK